MKNADQESITAADEKETFDIFSGVKISRRDLLLDSIAVGATVVVSGEFATAAEGKTTFTILHTNDMHSAFIGKGPAADYSPFSLNDDATRGGFARLACENAWNVAPLGG